jgi:hypothetical protein
MKNSKNREYLINHPANEPSIGDLLEKSASFANDSQTVAELGEPFDSEEAMEASSRTKEDESPRSREGSSRKQRTLEGARTASLREGLASETNHGC